MSQQSILELAKQGDPNAIAVLLNKSLNSKGISAEVTRERTLLKVIVESSRIPEQANLVRFVQTDLLRLRIPDVDALEISGQQTGTDAIAWKQKVSLGPAQSVTDQERQPGQNFLSSLPETERQANRSPAQWIAIAAVGAAVALGFAGFAYYQSSSSAGNGSGNSAPNASQSPSY